MSYSQSSLTLDEAISIAMKNSLQSEVIKNTYSINLQNYQRQMAGIQPQIFFNANIPGYNSSITSVTQPDGTINFTSVEQAYSSLGISINQRIPQTGGLFTASSNLNRFDRLSGDKVTTYNAAPFSLGLNQPLFQFNETKFNLKVAEINKKIGSKEFKKQQEDLALAVCKQFFEVLQSQVNLEILGYSKIKTDSVLVSASIKRRLGKFPEEELLQVKMEQLQIKTLFENALSNHTILILKLSNLLGTSTKDSLKLKLELLQSEQLVPLIPDSALTYYRYFKENNPQFEQLSLQKLQVEANAKRAKLNKVPDFNIIAGYGGNQSSNQLSQAYQNILTQQNVTLGISAPISQGGSNTAALKIAKLEKENLILQLKQLELSQIEEIYRDIQSFNQSITQHNNSYILDSLSQLRYTITYNKYMAGKINYLDLMIAQNQLISSKQNYVLAIANYWNTYHAMRAKLLFDTKTKQKL